MSNDKRRWIEGIVFLVAFGLTIPAANWMIGNVGTVCAAERPVPHSGRAGPDGAVGRADDRHRAGAARSGAAPARRRLFRRRRGRRRHPVGAGGAAVAGAGVGRGVPAVGVRRPRGLYAACAPAVWSPRWWRRVSSASSSIPSSSCGSPSARSISCWARSSARAGWCCCRFPSCMAAPPRRAARPDTRPDEDLMSAAYDVLRRVTTAHHHHHAAQEGHPALLDEGRDAARCPAASAWSGRRSRSASCRCARTSPRRKAGASRSRRGPRSRPCRRAASRSPTPWASPPPASSATSW